MTHPQKNQIFVLELQIYVPQNKGYSGLFCQNPRLFYLLLIYSGY